jgi:hypothetical protein
MEGHLIKHEEALNFIFGENALFTIKNPKTENRFTFKVTKHKKEDIFFVKVLTNPDLYEFVGSVRIGNKYKHSTKSRISDNAQSVKVFDFVLNKLISKNLPDFIEIWHEGKCCKCGRTLTTPESIQRGIGPECFRRNASKADLRNDLINRILGTNVSNN